MHIMHNVLSNKISIIIEYMICLKKYLLFKSNMYVI